MPETLLTPAQVGRRLRVRPSFVLRLIRRRHLAAVKVGRAWRIEPQAVEAYISAHRTAVETDDAPVLDERQLSLLAPLAHGLDLMSVATDDDPLVMTLDADETVDLGPVHQWDDASVADDPPDDSGEAAS